MAIVPQLGWEHAAGDDATAGLSSWRCQIGGERDNGAVLEIGRRLRHQRAEPAAAAPLSDKERQLIGKIGFGSGRKGWEKLDKCQAWQA
jgi:hypothetical protein